MEKNKIAFKKGMILIDNKNEYNEEEAIKVQHMMLRYGYVLTEEAFKALCKANADRIEVLYRDIKYVLNDFVGETRGKTLGQLKSELGNTVTTSLLSYFQLVWDSNLGHEYIKTVYEHKTFTVIKLGREEDFLDIFTSLVSINAALTSDDQKLVEWFIRNYADFLVFPSAIPFKETLCMIASKGIDVPVKTSTDVLRIAVYMSTGTTVLDLPDKKIKASAWTSTLIDNPEYKKAQFKKFKRSERRFLLSLLDKVANPREMVLKRNRWIKLAEVLHPGDYSDRYLNAYKSIQELRNLNVKSWFADVDAAFKKSFTDGLNFLSQRPGEFARRLDALLRNNPAKQMQILLAFKECAYAISSKVLWELITHFKRRTLDDVVRSIKLVSSRTRTILPTLTPLEKDLVDKITSTIMEVFHTKFSKLDKLGNVFIDPKLKKVPLPTDMRTLNSALKVAIRGTRIPLEVEKKVLRPFIYWTSRNDIDLSMSFIKKGSSVEVCSYRNTNPRPFISHSGDIVPRTTGEWREYIDIVLKDNDYDYAIMSIRNFSGGSLANEGAVVGFAEFDNENAGAAWNSKVVTNSYKLTSSGANCILLAIDFKTKEWILIDEDEAGIPVEFGNDPNKLISYFIESPGISVYDLLVIHAEARGKHVVKEEDAEMFFKYEDFIFSYEKIASYMI